MLMPTEQQMHNAVAARDTSSDGHFFYAVITTGIFCLPSCTSRAAKPENLRFFATAQHAVDAGFRPCKLCRPNEAISRSDRLVQIARHIEAHADERLTLQHLATLARLSPSRLQRVFKQAFGVSPKAYQDAVRMQRFKQSLKDSDSVTDAIFSSGFGSISRVYGEDHRNIGMSPKVYRAGGAGEQITYACRDTVLGLMGVAATDKGVCFAQFAESTDALLNLMEAEFPNASLVASHAQNAPELDAWIEALNEHVSHGAPRPDLPLDIRGTLFQMKVWRFLLSLKDGSQLSYSELAAHIEKPKAVRAVASACARNRIAILIPCHRVLRGDGSLGGYRWGLERKQALLDSEKARAAHQVQSPT